MDEPSPHLECMKPCGADRWHSDGGQDPYPLTPLTLSISRRMKLLACGFFAVCESRPRLCSDWALWETCAAGASSSPQYRPPKQRVMLDGGLRGEGPRPPFWRTPNWLHVSTKHSAVLHSALERYAHGLECTQHSALSKSCALACIQH